MEHYALDSGIDANDLCGVPARGRCVIFVVEELKAVFDPARRGLGCRGSISPSILAAIGGVIEQHLVRIGLFIDGAGLGLVSDPAAAKPVRDPSGCFFSPSCGAYEMVMIEGAA